MAAVRYLLISKVLMVYDLSRNRRVVYGQGDSEKIRFPLSSDERDGLSAITLNQFNGSGG